MDISINITTHSEGLLFYRTFRSIESQIRYLINKNRNIKYEVNISLDNPTEDTIGTVRTVIDTFGDIKLNVFELEESDLAACRNFLISKSKGRYIVFFDGDDFFSKDYLCRCFLEAEKYKKPAIYTADNFITFERENLFWKKIGSRDDSFNPAMLLLENPFPSQVFVHRDVYRNIKYESIKKGSGYGMEDMHWNAKAINAGYEFIVVQGTLHCYRVKRNGSLLNQQQSGAYTIRSSAFFEPDNFYNTCKNGISVVKPKDFIGPTEECYDYNRLRSLYEDNMPLTIRRYIVSMLSNNKAMLQDLKFIIKNILGKSDKTALDIRQGIDLIPKEELFKKIGNCFSSQKAYDIFWDQWAELNQYEPMINQNIDTIIQTVNYDIFEKGDFSVAYEYYKFCKYVIDNKLEFKHIVFIPWLITGGSDNFTIRIANYLAKKGGVLLICTDKFNTNKGQELEDGVIYYDFSRIFKEGNQEEYINKFYLRIIQNFNLSTCSIINSRYANELIIKYGKQISDSVKIFSYRWSIEKNYNNNYRESPDDLYQKTYKNIAAIVTDNHKTLEDIRLIMNPDEKRVGVLDMPITKHPYYNDKFTKSKKRILIAGRIAKWDKMIETSIEVAASLAILGIDFDFYGTLDDYYDYNQKFLGLIDNFPNINYKGSYEKFEDINTSLYDALLMISRSEGMPNVVLESIGANLFIVSTRVGGVPWVIESGVNGYLVDDPSDVSQYVNAVKKFYKNRNKDSFKRQIEFNQKIISERTEENFKERVKKVYTI